jgi:hypothetical protein
VQVLFIGDVFGKPGRNLVASHLPVIRSQFDFVIANGENAAGGFGLNRESFDVLTRAGVNAITLGNHAWDNREVFDLTDDPRLIRPLNIPLGAPGRGFGTFTVGESRITVVNLLGRLFMNAADDPFAALETMLETQVPERNDPGAIIVDFHAEATSEKACLAWHVDGRVAAVLGTHTHIATADTRFLSAGTAFQSDVGMTGPVNSSIGMGLAGAIYRFRTGLPHKIVVADGPSELNAVKLEIAGNRVVRMARYRFAEGQAQGHLEGEVSRG